jgi:predicted  nucleic acid-binding Zn-ribbon protein
MSAKTEISILHIRRCHVCGTVNESENQAIRQCTDCGKHLAPFYYFDESQLMGLAENGYHLSQVKDRDPTQVETFKPLWGFSTYW